MNKVVTLETARKLKEAGWAQDNASWYYSIPTDTHPEGTYELNYCPEESIDVYSEDLDPIAAPDTTELLDALPQGVELVKFDGCFLAEAPEQGIVDRDAVDECTGKTPAEALAALWLELRKQKLV